jgi:uroporphyrinogen decarboxylase
MTSRERIKKTLEFKMPDRIGIFDDFADSAVKKWRNDGSFPEEALPQEYFDFDVRLFGFNQNFHIDSKNVASLERINNPSIGESLRSNYDKTNSTKKFLILGFMEPFEHVARIVGKERLLTMMAEEADKARALFTDSLEFTLNVCQLMLDKGYRFDAAWMWGDVGYKDRLIFSTDYYNRFLFDLHRECCDFFAKNGMPVMFHSDGDISELIPHLIRAGIRAIEPLESNMGMDLVKLKKEYGRDIILFGGVDETSFLDTDKAEKEIKSKFKYLMKGGGYIYHADSPILDNISFENYKNVIGLVKRYGKY